MSEESTERTRSSGAGDGLHVAPLLHVHRFGSASDRHPAVGLHGWGGTHQTFAPLEPWRPAHRGMVCPDLPGYGRSPAPERWRWDGVAEMTLQALRQAGVQPGATVIGSCSGALLALEIARLHPEAFSRLVLVDPFAWMPWYFRIFTWPLVGRIAYMTAFANPLGRWLGNRALARHRADDSDLTGSFSDQRHDTTLHFLAMLRDLRGPEVFQGAGGELIIVHGERTFGAVRAGIPAWQRALPIARVVEVEGAGHLPITEQPGAVAPLIWAHPGSASGGEVRAMRP